MSKRLTEKPNRYFTFLRGLRAGGRSNMYGAIPYLMSAFGISREEAFRVVCEWIDVQISPAAMAATRPPMRGASQVSEPAEPSLFDQSDAPANILPPKGQSRRPSARGRKARRPKPSRPKAA